MKFTAIAFAFLQKATLAEEQLYWQDYADYPLEGQNMQNTLSGRRSGTLDTRQIFHRKRLINSQVTSKSNGAAWYFQYHDYGCYCVAPSDPKKNRGRPVDAIDSACKRHNMCYQCAYADFSNARRECNPKQMGYQYRINKNVETGNIKIECTNSQDTCAYATCMCDKALADELGNLAMKGTLAEKDNRNYDAAKCGASPTRSDPSPEGVFNDDMGAFDFENQITFLTEPEGADVPQQCCGVYPQRFPYKSSTHECCSIGGATEELKPLGTC